MGIAWRPRGPDTVLRAGFGVFYDLVPRNRSTAGGSPFSITEPDYTNPAGSPTVIFPRVFPDSGSGVPKTISIPPAINPYSVTPYSMQKPSPWSPPALELRASRSYIGTKYVPGRVGLQHEPAAPDGNLTSASRAPSRSIRTSTTTPTAPGPIHSAPVQVTRHAPRAAGFGRASIPWGARIGDLEKGAFAREPLDRKREGPCGRYSAPPWKPPRLGIPIGKGKHFLNGLNRWQTPHPGWMEVNAIYTRSRATFLTPLCPTRSHRTAYTASSTPATVTHTADPCSATPIFPAARDSRPVVRRERSSPRPRRGPSHLAKA